MAAVAWLSATVGAVAAEEGAAEALPEAVDVLEAGVAQPAEVAIERLQVGVVAG